MKKLKAGDIVKISKIISKADIRNLLKDLFKTKEETSKESGELIIDLIYKLLENMDKIDVALFEFVGFMLDKPFEEVSELPLNEFTSFLIDIFKSENFIGFFKLAAK